MEQHPLETPSQSAIRHDSPAGSLNQTPFPTAMSPPMNRRNTPGSLQPSPRMPHAESIRRSRSVASMSPALSLPSQMRHGELLQSIESRPPPSRDFEEPTIDDAYINFIFYCNPDIPTTKNTAELRRIFRSPPRSDGKTFNIYDLWMLIQKFNRKELRTWSQLALELGVEPPSAEKKQSTQKVQQYAVRLKRWMRAMHVDAFFDYCLGIQHPYYCNTRALPNQGGDTKDEVPREEDPALRALFPEWKPRKGRKRVPDESKDTNGDNTNSTYAPWSAIPGDYDNDNWTTHSLFNSSIKPEHQRHTAVQGLNQMENSTKRSSLVQYPLSAVTPRSKTQDFFGREPRSAISPSSAERMHYKRRRIDATSSFWAHYPNAASDTTSSRPPDEHVAGPDAALVMGETNEPSHSHITPDSSTLHKGDLNKNDSLTSQGAETPNRSNSSATRPTKLQLQVPQGPQLAAPQLLINGEFRPSSASVEGSSLQDNSQYLGHDTAEESISSRQRSPLRYVLSINNIIRKFSIELQRGTIVAPSPLSEEKINIIAELVVEQLMSECAPDSSPLSVAHYCAVSLGIGNEFGLGGKRIGHITTEISPEDRTTMKARDVEANIPTPSTSLDSNPHGPPRVECVVNYNMALTTSVTTSTTMHISLPPFAINENEKSTSFRHQDSTDTITDQLQMRLDNSDDELTIEPCMDWRQRYLNLKRQIQEKDVALRQYKKKILEVVMDGV
ncbi:hypothetical protein LOZ64_004279 [Ophidiomyces ophidiicola]|nr:hypothetical protein LOZ64_004279 [Ophidiomyces ophidiicola]KAI2009409.1 hypothetical protein LOZ49_003883 [Ophidiomyces ophidiicola]KAI2019102.1 hypothetical protein LOZ46_003476 [Ophidiomyces ophidiicola]KAI2139518.1 hypothetical protein LOZ29_002432 [Ophidiomyces ophidiicola]KAI2140814.1 hypothetical protein LOZ28_002707 [Ophidiomyces ophidiicola]